MSGLAACRLCVFAANNRLKHSRSYRDFCGERVCYGHNHFVNATCLANLASRSWSVFTSWSVLLTSS
jgi:hypothetical protein